MHVHPSSVPTELFKRKDFWLAAYLAALHRLSADDAVVDADQALRRADERWENPPTVGSWRYEHEYPVGTTFGHADEPR